MEEIADNKRYRNFMVLLYKDSTSYDFNQVLFNIHGFKYYAYIKHDPEIEESKEHYHVFIHLDTASTEEALSKRIGIQKNYIQYIKNVRAGCRYLTHIDYPDKIQYKIEDVKISGLFKRKFLKNFEDIKTEEEIIQDIYFWIDNSHFDSYVEKLKYMIMFINLNCYDSVYKRYRPEFLDYLKMNL